MWQVQACPGIHFPVISHFFPTAGEIFRNKILAPDNLLIFQYIFAHEPTFFGNFSVISR
jgi:hypothetical protein